MVSLCFCFAGSHAAGCQWRASGKGTANLHVLSFLLIYIKIKEHSLWKIALGSTDLGIDNRPTWLPFIYTKARVPDIVMNHWSLRMNTAKNIARQKWRGWKLDFWGDLGLILPSCLILDWDTAFLYKDMITWPQVTSNQILENHV